MSEQAQLEALLTTRLKALEGELAEARRDRDAATSLEVWSLIIGVLSGFAIYCIAIDSRCAVQTQSKAVISSLQQSLETSAALVARLEKDLEEGLSSRAAVPGSGVAGDMGLTALLLPDPRPVKTATPGASESMKGQGQRVTDGSTGSSMSTILQAQRDRYKDRLVEVR